MSRFEDYEIIGDVREADSIIGQSFGARVDEPGLVNEHLAEYIIEQLPPHLIRALQQEISMAMQDRGRVVEHTIQGDPSTALGAQLDSFGLLTEARDWLFENGYQRPVLVGHAHQMGRLILQARKLEIDIVTTPGLPQQYDPQSTQFWTRNPALWTVREALGKPYLKAVGKL